MEMENIPAFPLWKMLHEMVPYVFNNDDPEHKTIHTFTKMFLESAEFANVFLCNNFTVSLQVYEVMSQKYKAFTMWLLGRLFYFVNKPKLSKIVQTVATDCQLRILYQIKSGQPHTYNEIISEYSLVLKQLVEYTLGDPIKIVAFIPSNYESFKETLDLSPIFVTITNVAERNHAIRKALKIIAFCLSEITYISGVNNYNCDLIDLCNKLVSTSVATDIKLSIYEMYLQFYKRLNMNDYPIEFVHKITQCLDHLQITFNLLVNNTIALGKDFFEAYEKVLCELTLCRSNLTNDSRKTVLNIAELVVDNKELFTINTINVCIKAVGAPRKTIDIFDKYNLGMLFVAKTEILKQILANISSVNSLTVNVCEISDIWKEISQEIFTLLDKNKCDDNECSLQTVFRHLKTTLQVATSIKISLKQNSATSSHKFVFIPDNIFLFALVDCLATHLDHVNTEETYAEFLQVCVHFPTCTNVDNLGIYAHLIINDLYLKTGGRKEFDTRCVRNMRDVGKFGRNFKMIVEKLGSVEFKLEFSLRLLEDFCGLSKSGIVDVKIDVDLVGIVKTIYEKINRVWDLQMIYKLLQCLLHCHKPNIGTKELITKILINIFQSKNQSVLLQATKSLKTTLCLLLSDCTKVLNYNEDLSFEINTYCDSCNKFQDNTSMVFCKKYENDDEQIGFGLFNAILELLKNTTDNSVRINLIEVLPVLAKHTEDFHKSNVTKVWIVFPGDGNKEIREAFNRNVKNILLNIINNSNITEQYKSSVVNQFYDYLYDTSKMSLQENHFDLQQCLLKTIEQSARVVWKDIVFQYIRLLLYFIMIPSSDHKYLAINLFIELSKEFYQSPVILYNKYKRCLCADIILISAINYHLCSHSLCISLAHISLVLGFHGSETFLRDECRFLLACLVPLRVTAEGASELEPLVEEMAAVGETDVAHLLAENYGHVFIQVRLHEEEEKVERAMSYMERGAGMKAGALLRRNFKVIINELLLNIHEKEDRVLDALKLLLSEEDGIKVTTIEDIANALQSRLLGILHYFDHHLIVRRCAKKKVLQSLVVIFRYMGAKRLAPSKFKILATLRSALHLDYAVYPSLNCDAWDAFVRNCDIEVLAPQLATIFVSLLPLLKTNEDCINNIFRYLVITHQPTTSKHIADLFFIPSHSSSAVIHADILSVISRHIPRAATPAEHLTTLQRHLQHDTLDVRLLALDALRSYLRSHRVELQSLILNRRGVVEAAVVSLVDTLTAGCRDKDEGMRIKCGECIGELGAIEPSHLPRKKNIEGATTTTNGDKQAFAFYVDDAEFIVSSLVELTRALHSEKHTQNLDRFALSIQETLRHYDISPEVTSRGHELWSRFSEAQQQLMLPWLKSRYKIVQNEPVFPASTVIYNSSVGGSFNSWAFNWAHKLVNGIHPKHKPLLQVYLISMRQDQRTLIHFLPHILLHHILEMAEDDNSVYGEFCAVLDSVECRRKVDDTKWSALPVEGSSMRGKVTEVTTSTQDRKQTQYTKVIFVLLDFLDRWRREYEFHQNAHSTKPSPPDSAIRLSHYNKVQSFLAQFCHLQLARCNYYCGEYARALMHLEDYIDKNEDRRSAVLPSLANIYAQLDESDGVAGVAALTLTLPSVEQRILALEVSGKLADAAACYERLPRPLSRRQAQGLVGCYLRLDSVHTALAVARDMIAGEREDKLLEMQVEPLWRLGMWEELEELLEEPAVRDNDEFQVNVGRSLLHLQHGRRDAFQLVIRTMRKQQVAALAAASLENAVYQHEYDRIARLHAITELEQVERYTYAIIEKPVRHKELVAELMEDWQLRLKVVQQAVRIREPLLCLRRAAIRQARSVLSHHSISPTALDALLGELWLESGKTARHSDMLQQAYSYLLKAEQAPPVMLFVQQAKLHWMREEHEQALARLSNGIENLKTDHPRYKQIKARAKLLIANYNDRISNVDTEVNIQYYKEAVDTCKDWEKSLVYIAQYYEKVLRTFPEDSSDPKASELQIHMINFFGKSLQYGCKYIHQSMPRMLSIWFDYGTRVLVEGGGATGGGATGSGERRSNLLMMTKLIHSFLAQLPTFVFLSAFSQLISRICHPQKEVYMQLKHIIIRLLLHHPQPTLWMLIPVIKSSYSLRARRCAEILNDPLLRSTPTHSHTPSTTALSQLVTDFTRLAERLIELCNKPVSADVSTVSVGALVRALPRLLAREDMSPVMVPTRRGRELLLPAVYGGEVAGYNAFPGVRVYVVGIEDEMQILPSMQRPRKITLRGSDGRKYIQMLKPKDDLRRDFRLMEFNDVVNGLLKRDADSRQRRLAIRLYSVAPLNEECGLIEWVDGLVGLRPTLMALYRQKNLGMRARALKDACCALKDPIVKKRRVFNEVLLVQHPPLLPLWFRRTFADVQAWLTARNTYTRTVAVMSMVGYVLGLGDRHGENILLDTRCGDAVHVDFNCLFNKGETFEWPERVPFRLTHNMVAAMGPLGVEGLFRKSSTSTLRVLRTNTCTLMSIVTPFVYDPMVSWPRATSTTNQTSSSVAGNAERTNEQAVEHVRNIELRLRGQVKEKTTARGYSMPLSVEGQVNKLIVEATSVDNLCQMYFGWGPYL